MLKHAVAVLICAALMFSAPAFAVDGVVLINQSTVMAAGGFPYKITQPGSYKLSGNLVVPASADGIDVQVNNVTIDLNGFTISGPATCTGSGSGISCGQFTSTVGIDGPINHSGLAVRNGSVVGFYTGVYAGGVNNLVEEINTTGNVLGIDVSNAVVRRNTSSLNGADGIRASNSTVLENVANYNGHYGLDASGGVVYGSNTFDGNGGYEGVSYIFYSAGDVSQHNNICDATTC
jgi:hypothetical protein